jgi:hypothetical protein
LENPGALPAPLQQDVTYFAVNVTSTTLQLSLTSGGGAITLTTQGSGNMSMFASSVPVAPAAPSPGPADGGPDFATEASRAGDYPARHFDQRERKLLQSIKRYVDAAVAGITPTTLSQTLFGPYASFASLAGAGITNTGNSVITGDIGTSTSTITGFPPGIVSGAQHTADSTTTAAQTQNAFATAYLTAQAPGTTVSGDLGGTTLVPGVYHSTSTLGITGTVTLDAGGNPNAQFIIQMGTALTTAASSVVLLVNGASAQNVAWLCGSAATLGATSTFNGNIVANTGISLGSGATVHGRLWSKTASVTLIDDAISTM